MRAGQVVFSRTFGSAAPGGGIGVRMMVPLLDLLNHGGVEEASVLQSTADCSNVRCQPDTASPVACTCSGMLLRGILQTRCMRLTLQRQSRPERCACSGCTVSAAYACMLQGLSVALRAAGRWDLVPPERAACGQWEMVRPPVRCSACSACSASASTSVLQQEGTGTTALQTRASQESAMSLGIKGSASQGYTVI